MVALVQRVRSASVSIDGEIVGQINGGLCILLGIHRDDSQREVQWVARKCAALRIFSDDDGKMNRSLIDVGLNALIVSQFTLYGSVERGNRPSFESSATPDVAVPLYEAFVSEMERLLNKKVPTGRFGAMMDVELINDGPVTIWVEKKAG